jgi:RHS repeat-associated protein
MPGARLVAVSESPFATVKSYFRALTSYDSNGPWTPCSGGISVSPARLAPVLLALFSACFLAPFASAQITGASDIQATPTPGVGHDYIRLLAETVEPSNGQLSLRIDVPTRGGRGGIPYAYFYNSAGVHHVIPTTPAGRAQWVTDISDTQGSGWSDSHPRITAIKGVASSNEPGPPPYTASCVYFTNYVFQDSSGARHALALQTAQSNDGASPNHCSQVFSSPTNALTGGDGYVYVANTSAPPVDTVPTNPPPVTIVGSDGTFYSCGQLGLIGSGRPTAFYESECGTGTDRNGNGLLAQPSISVTTTSETVPWQAFPFNYVTDSIPQANCFGINPVSPGQMNVYQSINFPNGKSYVFSYDPVYGLVNQITYPTGGYTKYVWNLAPRSQAIQTSDNTGITCEFEYDAPVITNRYVSFDGVNIALEQDFQYPTPQWSTAGNGADSWQSKRTIVISKDCARNNFNCNGAPSFTTTYNYVGPGSVARQNAVETSVVYGDFNGSTLLTETKGWSGQALLCDLKTLDNGLTSGAFYTYGPNPYGFVALAQITDKKEYDYGLITSTSACPAGGAGAPQGITPTRDTVTNYASFAATPYFPYTPSILDRPSSVITYSGSSSSGTRVAETDYGYDQTAVSAVSPAPWDHDETNYSASYNNRGNATTVTRKCLQTCVDAVTKYTYDETGQAMTMIDPCGNAACTDMTGSSHTTLYSYADSYTVLSGGLNVAYTPSSNTDAFLTKITDALGHTENFTYDFNNGQLTVSKDENSQSTTYLYNDSLSRPTKVNYPDSGLTTIGYNDSPYNPSTPSPSVTTTKAMSSSTNLVTLAAADGLGHVVKTLLTTDPDCASGDRTDTTYDGLGRVYTTSNPYCTTSDPTYGLTTYTYDALGRTIQVTNPDNSTILTTYTGRATQNQDEGNGNGAQRMTRISQTDGLGRLSSLCEVAPGPFVGAAGSSSSSLIGSSGSPVACGQDIGGTGFLTSYRYNSLDNLLQVSQSGIASRTFGYDSLSRLTSATNPESGTATYTYDANGNLFTKAAPAPNQTGTATVTTSYQYDALNRLLQKSYSDTVPTYANGTPTVNFGYDQSTVTINGTQVSLVNSVGRMSSEATLDQNAVPNTMSAFSYDPVGRLAVLTSCVNVTCTANLLSMKYLYDFLGNETDRNLNGSDFASVYNTAGRLTSFSKTTFTSPTNPGNLLSATSYDAFGHMVFATFANGLSQSWAFDKLGRPTSMAAGTTCAAGSCATTAYGYTLSHAPDGNVLTANDTANGNWNYSYDQFNRLVCSNLATNGNCASPTSGKPTYSYVYDRYGNRWQQNGPNGPNSFLATFTGNNPGAPANNNRMDGYSYDAAGNTLSDGSHSYAYDAENRIHSVGGSTGTVYFYDAEGRRLERTVNGAVANDYFYDGQGHMMIETIPAAPLYQEIYAAGMHLATYTLNSAHTAADLYFHHNDWLGTERARTTYTGALCETVASLPFGDDLVTTSTCGEGDVSPMHFTGKERDSESGLDDFGARYFGSSLGRFMSPDGPFSDQNNENPQSWNLYTYARNNPLRFTDADGRACVQQEDGSYKTVGTEGQSCEDAATEEAGDNHVASAVVTPSHDDQIKMFAEDIGNIGTAQLKQDVLIMAAGAAGTLADAGIGILGARGAVARGGITPVLKGAAGVERAIAEIEAEGGTVIGTNVTIKTGVGKGEIVADVLYKDAEGNLVIGEAKNGPTADFNPNQRANGYPQGGPVSGTIAGTKGGPQYPAGTPISNVPVRTFPYGGANPK